VPDNVSFTVNRNQHLKHLPKLRELPFLAAGGEDAKPNIYGFINTMLDSRHILTSSGIHLKTLHLLTAIIPGSEMSVSYLVMQYEGGFSGRHHMLSHIHRNKIIQPNAHFRFNIHKVLSLTNSFIINKYSLPVKL